MWFFFIPVQGETLSCLVDFNHILCLCLINYLQRTSKGSNCVNTPCECTVPFLYLPLISYLRSLDVPETFFWAAFPCTENLQIHLGQETPAISNHLKLQMFRCSQRKKVERWAMPTCQKLFLGRSFFSIFDDT